MKITCQYSGTTYQCTGFGGTNLTYVHPIFTAEPKWLLSRMGDWAAQRFNAEENKLLFLAMLHTTDLVEFRTAAMPTEQDVALNMEQLARLVAWRTGISSPQLILPRFVVQHENRHLGNVRYWIETWNDAKKAFEDGYCSTSELRKLRDRETALERLIKNHTKRVEDYAGLLATWAMQAANVPKSLHDYWRKLFCLKSFELYNDKYTTDLQELLDHMEDNLEHGSIYAYTVLKYCQLLVKKNKAGLVGGLGMTDEEFDILTNSSFTIVDNATEQHNMQVAANAAPEDQPQPQHYASRVKYLLAKAQWELAQRSKSYSEQFTHIVEQQEQQADQDSIEAEDTVEDTEATEDFANQLAADVLENNDGI